MQLVLAFLEFAPSLFTLWNLSHKNQLLLTQGILAQEERVLGRAILGSDGAVVPVRDLGAPGEGFLHGFVCFFGFNRIGFALLWI